MKVTPIVDKDELYYDMFLEDINELTVFLGMHAFIKLTNYYDSLGDNLSDKDKIMVADKLKEIMNIIVVANSFTDIDSINEKELDKRINQTISEFDKVINK